MIAEAELEGLSQSQYDNKARGREAWQDEDEVIDIGMIDEGTITVRDDPFTIAKRIAAGRRMKEQFTLEERCGEVEAGRKVRLDSEQDMFKR